MNRPTRATAAGRAYLDLQNRARREGRRTGDLLTMYVVERWLARLSRSRYAADFILKGGMLLATFDARRPTADADTLARNLPSDQQSVVATVSEIAGIADPDDGVLFHPDTVAARTIRDAGMYEGTRVTMQTTLASAKVKLSLDVNFGDPVVPPPGWSGCRRCARAWRTCRCSAIRSRR